MKEQDLTNDYINLYENTFEDFTNQFKLLIRMSIEKDSISEELFSQFVTNLLSELKTFEKSLTNNEKFRNFYGPKIDFYHTQIRDLTDVYTSGKRTK